MNTCLQRAFFLLFLFTTFTHLLIAQCPEGQTEVIIHFQGDENMELDNSRWEISFGNGKILATGTEDAAICLPSNVCYTFTVYDDFGDGLAGTIPGFYELIYDDITIAAAVNFGFEQSAYFGGCEAGSSCFSPLEAIAGESYNIANGEQWYVFTPDISGSYDITTCGFNNSCNTSIWVYDRCLGLTLGESQEETIFYNDNSCEGNQASITGVLQAGSTYYLRVGDNNNACANQVFSWELIFNGEVMGCTDPLSCNFDPLATIDDGSCMYGPNPDCPSGPDLIVEPGVLANSIYATNVGTNACYVNEGCLQGYGTRQVVRFTTHIKNVGNEDYVIGSPDPDSNQFEYDDCHGHWHYEGYAEYRLYDQEGLALPVGFKNGFCVLDLECSGGGNATYGCGYMGISAGCGDIYGSGLACQWIDVTELPEGFYTLVIVVNWDRDADLFGRDEVSYDNNWDQVCFLLVRDVNNNHNIKFVDECPVFTDCEGEIQGDAQPDCYGICGGDGKYGDLNINTLYETGDISMYINGILDNIIPVTNCTDLTNNDIVDLEDPAWLMDCILVENQADGHISHAHSCQLPTIGITNNDQEATFSLLEHNIEEQSIVIGLENPAVDMIATHLKINGLEVSNAELLLTDYDAQLFFRPDGQLITFSYSFDTAPRSSSALPFIKIYYSSTTSDVACLEAWTTINNDLERVMSLTGTDNCLADIEPCSETSPLDSDDDGVCDDMDICPGGNDNIDTDEDGIPDFCDACPDSTAEDSDNDGVCDDIDLCIGVDDSLFCEQYQLILLFDDYPQESSWEVLNENGEVVASHPLYPFEVEFTTIEESFCLPAGSYTFFMFDTFGDGMCCSYGIGGYELIRVATGEVVGSGGEFDAISSVDFAATGILAFDEDGDGVCDPNDQCPGQDDNLDTDGDGIPNGCDTCPPGDFVDSDNDGICDEADICPDGDDTTDSDEDGIPNGCDDCPNSATGDTDLDGVCDDLDICPGFNDLEDADNDGMPDGCDDCPNSAAGDSDGDTICDDLDVCPGFNDLADTDNDGIPDGCDNCPNTALNDSDNDGICDDIDICIGGDDNIDTDEDGTPDFCDICPTLTDNPDEDEDGICDNIDQCVGADDNTFCSDVVLTIIFDDFAVETSWIIINENGNEVWNGGDFSFDDNGTEQIFTTCLPLGTYTFTIFDTANDGLCCGYGKGGYYMTYAGEAEPIAQGADFGSFDATTFTVQNANAPDEDQDGVCDPMDICPGGDDNVDTDSDGMPDACDDCPNSATGDSDGDSVCDDEDLCPGFDDNIDIDEDGIPDGCDDVINSIEDISALNTIQSLFPNPTEKQLQIVFNIPVDGVIEIIDLFGRKHQKLNLSSIKKQNLQVDHLAAGTYLVVFTQDNGKQQVRRFVKM